MGQSIGNDKADICLVVDRAKIFVCHRQFNLLFLARISDRHLNLLFEFVSYDDKSFTLFS